MKLIILILKYVEPFFGVDKLRDEKEQYEQQLKTGEQKISKILSNYYQQLIIVPGNEKRFFDLEGYNVKVVNLKNPNTGILIPDLCGFRDYKGFQKTNQYCSPPEILLEHKVIGLIEANFDQSDWSSRWNRGTERIYYGLPVERIEPH